MLFCCGYSYENETKSTHHFNRLLLCDRNDSKEATVPLTDKDIIRIKKEIETIKTSFIN
jgi:hypothetical protein